MSAPSPLHGARGRSVIEDVKISRPATPAPRAGQPRLTRSRRTLLRHQVSGQLHQQQLRHMREHVAKVPVRGQDLGTKAYGLCGDKGVHRARLDPSLPARREDFSAQMVILCLGEQAWKGGKVLSQAGPPRSLMHAREKLLSHNSRHGHATGDQQPAKEIGNALVARRRSAEQNERKNGRIEDDHCVGHRPRSVSKPGAKSTRPNSSARRAWLARSCELSGCSPRGGGGSRVSASAACGFDMGSSYVACPDDHAFFYHAPSSASKENGFDAVVRSMGPL